MRPAQKELIAEDFAQALECMAYRRLGNREFGGYVACLSMPQQAHKDQKHRKVEPSEFIISEI